MSSSLQLWASFRSLASVSHFHVSFLARVSRTFLELPSKDLTLWSVYFDYWLSIRIRGGGQRNGEESKFSVNSIGCYSFTWKLLSTYITNIVCYITWIFPLPLHLGRDCGWVWVILEAQTILKSLKILEKYCFFSVVIKKKKILQGNGVINHCQLWKGIQGTLGSLPQHSIPLSAYHVVSRLISAISSFLTMVGMTPNLI